MFEWAQNKKKWKTFFQAALDTKHKMGPAAEKLNLIHFNDVYNVEQRDKEPEGGAARWDNLIVSLVQ